MVYDLTCETVRLTVEISSRQNADALGEWNVEAHAREAPEKPTVGRPGATRADALQAVAEAWGSKAGVLGFPSVDWTAVAAALRTVRAI